MDFPEKRCIPALPSAGPIYSGDLTVSIAASELCRDLRHNMNRSMGQPDLRIRDRLRLNGPDLRPARLKLSVSLHVEGYPDNAKSRMQIKDLMLEGAGDRTKTRDV